MIKVSLNDFIKELNKQNPEKPIKLFLGNTKNSTEIMLLFNNSGYYLTDKIQKIDYAEHNKLLPKFDIQINMYKGDDNWNLFVGSLHNRYDLSEYPEMLI
jgi:hypothetical protein